MVLIYLLQCSVIFQKKTTGFQVNELNKEIARFSKEMQMADRSKAELMAKLEQTENENRALETSLMELREGLRNVRVAPDSDHILECPMLEKLLAAMDAKRLMGDFDTGLYMKVRPTSFLHKTTAKVLPITLKSAGTR